MPVKLRSFTPVLAAGVVLSICGCGTGIRIETGETPQTATHVSEKRGKALRTRWAQQFDNVSLVDKVHMLVVFVDSVNASYFRFGDYVADEWRKANAQSGRVIPDSEMRTLISNSVKAQKPLMESYEDVIEYSHDEIRRLDQFDQQLEDHLAGKIDIVYEIESRVFYPNGTVDEYENRLLQLQSRSEELSRLLMADLQRY